MAPRRRPRKRGHTRMDAALDAMSPYGFPAKLVRRTVDQLLKVYGGNDGWVFVEDAAYTLLIETLLEKQSIIASEAQAQDGLIEDNPGDGGKKASPAGCSNGVLVPCSNTQTSYAASPTEAVDTVSAASETGNQFPIKAVDTVSAGSETGNRLPIKAIDTVSTANESDCQPAGNFALDEIHGDTLAYSPPQTKSAQRAESVCHQRRRPYHGWISSDDEGELIQLPPAPMSKVLSMLINDGVN